MAQHFRDLVAWQKAMDLVTEPDSAGSLAELETRLLLAERLGYTDSASTEALLKRAHEAGRILNGLILVKSLPE